MKKICIFVLFLPLFCAGIQAQHAPVFRIELSSDIPQNQPVFVASPVVLRSDTSYALIQIIGKQSIVLPFQIEEGPCSGLWFMQPEVSAAKGKRFLELRYAPQPHETTETPLLDDGNALIVRIRGRNALAYHYARMFPPEGIDSAYCRSGFIHPLWSPAGQVITRIQPPDHYHHYGLWNPWTKTTIKGREIDFWNLYKKQGTVRFAGFLSRVSGPVYSGFSVLHQHIAYPDTDSAFLALNEVLQIKVFQTDGSVFVADVTSTLSCAADFAVSLDEYRYGGLGLRANEAWTNQNTTILTSGGKSRADADGSRGRWCMASASLTNGQPTVAILGHPANFNFPEPLRVWPPDANEGRGDVFLNFCPTKNRSQLLIPDRQYTLRYRIITADSVLTISEIEAMWNTFAYSCRN